MYVLVGSMPRKCQTIIENKASNRVVFFSKLLQQIAHKLYWTHSYQCKSGLHFFLTNQ